MNHSATAFSVTILGSGTCIPSLKRSSCAAMVNIAGKKVLIDCGPGTMHRLLAANTEIFDISYIFLSHFHLDHSGELAPLLFTTRYFGTDGVRKLKLSDGVRKLKLSDRDRRPLTLAAGKGLVDFYDRLKYAYGQWVELPEERLRLVEIDNAAPDSRDFGGFTLATAPVAHNPESVALRLSPPDGRAMVYSGDTGFSESLIELATGADLLICEAAIPHSERGDGQMHLSPELAGEIARRAGVKQLVLTHFYPECEAIDIKAACRKTYDGPLRLAEDLMEISL